MGEWVLDLLSTILARICMGEREGVGGWATADLLGHRQHVGKAGGVQAIIRWVVGHP